MSQEVEFIVGFSLFVGILVLGFCLWWEWIHDRIPCCPHTGSSMRQPVVQYAPMHWPQPPWQHQQNAQQWQYYNQQQGNYAHGQGQNNESHNYGHLPLPTQMVKVVHEFSNPPKVENPRPAPNVYQLDPHPAPNVYPLNPHPAPSVYQSNPDPHAYQPVVFEPPRPSIYSSNASNNYVQPPPQSYSTPQGSRTSMVTHAPTVQHGPQEAGWTAPPNWIRV